MEFENKKNGYVHGIVSHKIFKGDFKIQSIVISHDSKYMVLGGKDGLIEVWSYDQMALDLNLPYQAQDLFMVHRKAILSMVFS